MGTIRQTLVEWLQTPGGRRIATDLGFFTILFTFVTIAYGPSLKHPPRADQWCYLTDTMNDHTFLDTLRHSYSYNRTRQVNPGDTDLFRPLLFTLLAAEKCAFGGNLALSQGFGIVLHCAVCVLFFLLVRRAVPALRADGGSGRDALLYATVTFFALNPFVQELVIWTHLHGYLLFLLFLFGSMLALFRFTESAEAGRPSGASAAAAWVLALCAAFTYELGQIYAVMAGMLLALTLAPRIGKVRAAVLFAAFAALAVVYQATNAVDLRLHEGQFEPEHAGGQILARAFEPATLTHAKRYVVYTAVQPFFPALIETGYGGQRLLVAESLWTGRRLQVLTPTHALSCGTLAAAVVLGLIGLWRTRERSSLVAIALATGLAGTYAAVTVLGRMNLRPGPFILSSNSYYAYTALLFAFLGTSVAWQGSCASCAGTARKGLAAGLVLLAALGAERVWQANFALARDERNWAQPLRAVHAFVEEHQGEQDFTFAIDYTASDPIPEMYGRPITEVVFSKWLSANAPRYRVVLRDGKVCPAGSGR